MIKHNRRNIIFDNLLVIFVSFIVIIFARFYIHFDTDLLSADDYIMSLYNPNTNINIFRGNSIYLKEGRFITHLTLLFDYLIANTSFVTGHISTFLFVLQIVFVCLLSIRILSYKRNSKWLIISVILLMGLHPNICQLLFYKYAIYIFSVTNVIILPILGVYFIEKFIKTHIRLYFIFGFLLTIYCLFIYQTVIVLPISLLLAITLKESLLNDKKLLHKFLFRLSLIVSVLIGYLLIVKFTSYALDIKLEQRTNFPSSIEQVGEQLHHIINLLKAHYFKDIGMQSIISKYLVLLVFLSAISRLFYLKFLFNRHNNLSLLNYSNIIFLLCLFGLIFSSLFPGAYILGSTDFPRHYLFFYYHVMLITYLGFVGVTGSIFRIYNLFSGIIVLLLVINNNNVSVNQSLLVKRDLALANRIVGHIESMPNFRTKKIQFLGLKYYNSPYDLKPFTDFSNIHLSAFSRYDSSIRILQYVSGYKLNRCTNCNIYQLQKKYYNKPKYPNKGSIFIDEDVIFVKF